MSQYDQLDLRILKYLISNKKNAIDFVNNNESKLFSGDLWNFANLVMGYVKTNKELPTLRILNDKLSKTNNEILFKKISEVWNILQPIEVDSKEYKHDVDKLRKKYAEKQIIETKDQLSKIDIANIDISKTVSDLQKKIQIIKSLDNYKTYISRDVKDYLQIFVDKYNAKQENPNLETGLKTGYSFLDYATNGMKPSDFMLIAGESGFGKSLFLKNIAIQIWLQNNQIFPTDSNPHTNLSLTGKNIIYFSLEMPYEDCFNRLLSRLSGVPSRNIENGFLNKEDYQKVKIVLDFIKNYPYQFKIVDIADASSNDLEAILMETGDTFDAVFVDYLGIMKTNEKNDDSDWLKQGLIAYELRAIARKYEIPLFSAVQLNRKSPGKDTSEKIGLSRLARSGTIATHATHVVQIESREKEETRIDFLYHLIKNRKGPKGSGVLIKNLSCATLIDKNDTPTDSNYDNFFKDQTDIEEEFQKLSL